MLTRGTSSVRVVALFAAGIAACLWYPSLASGNTDFSQTNLVSDVKGLAGTLDVHLANPWGLTSSATSPFWVSDQATGVSTLYDGSGNIIPLVVAIPGSSTPPSGPTGIVFNGTTGFAGPGGNPDIFIWATLNGTIAGWNGASNTATTQVPASGAVFTGLAEANNGTGNFLYAADFKNNTIDVFNTSFTQVTVPGGFTDPNMLGGYAPYNIQNVGGKLYVEYAPASPTGAVPGLGNGIVDVFDANGNLLQRLVTGGNLDDPWGITLAPAGFGSFGGDLLIGNFGNGEINAFDPTSGAFLGTLEDSSGNPIVNSGLWGLEFRTGGTGTNPDALYFNAGIDNQKDGLFGSIQPSPEPAMTFLLGSGLVGLIPWSRRKKQAKA